MILNGIHTGRMNCRQKNYSVQPKEEGEATTSPSATRNPKQSEDWLAILENLNESCESDQDLHQSCNPEQAD